MDVETVTVIRPPGKGKFGDPVSGSTTEFSLEGCMFAPGGSAEINANANSVDSNADLYVVGNTNPGVRPTDQIRARGGLYEVVGEPAVWGSFGTVIRVRRFVG